ncbi:MAG: CooT family nickel-binding protein [Proteobacteria bacterium]|nr:CooT family nickel-binding protein [Pseudomonadota bacterium]MBU1739311.1 CooT family nickel-binding protein [Pseudomonadota bacterium]
MCQMSVMLEKNGDPELIMENASRLEATDDGVTVTTLFEAPKTIPAVRVTRIDFLNGKVFLGPTAK